MSERLREAQYLVTSFLFLFLVVSVEDNGDKGKFRSDLLFQLRTVAFNEKKSIPLLVATTISVSVDASFVLNDLSRAAAVWVSNG